MQLYLSCILTPSRPADLAAAQNPFVVTILQSTELSNFLQMELNTYFDDLIQVTSLPYLALLLTEHHFQLLPPKPEPL